MGDNVKIQGLDDLTKIANPKQLKSAALAALSSGATEPKKGVRNAMPASLKKFKTILKHKRVKNSTLPMVEVGFFGKVMQYVNRRGVQWDAFMILYWHNYGTLSKRDSGHSFDRARKKKTANWRGGTSASHFWENGIAGTEDKALDKTAIALDKQVDKILVKNGFK